MQPDQHLILAVTSSVAAYKAPEIASHLTQRGFKCHCILTKNASQLISKQLLFAVSHLPVTQDLWALPTWNPDHISLAQQCQLLLVAPATANSIAKLAHGIADDAFTTIALAHSGTPSHRLLLAPAMNPRMWSAPATREAVATLKRRGAIVIGPASGRTACGEEGLGRMAPTWWIEMVTAAALALPPPQTPPGSRVHVLVTAGATREHFDGVRYLTNRSTGRQGLALAAAAVAAGAEVTLVHGPGVEAPPGVRAVSVVSTEDMKGAVLDALPGVDCLVMAAAPCDYRPASCVAGKVRKGQELGAFVGTPDILLSVSEHRSPGQVVVGFAAEADRATMEISARGKLERKRLDMLALNYVGPGASGGFGSKTNEVTLFRSNPFSVESVNGSKERVAGCLVARVLEMLSSKAQKQ